MGTKRAKVDREAPEVGAMARRMLRALVRRAAVGDLEALEELARIEAEIAPAVTVAGHLMATGERMAAAQSYSYTELGDALAITRQAARQRFMKVPSSDAAAYYADTAK